MTKSLILTANFLADVLVRENAALLRMDLRGATMLLPEKIAAIADLTASGEAGYGPPRAALLEVARRLDDLAMANRRLLERAIAAQRRVIGIVLRAADSAVAVGPSYGATGRPARRTRPMAMSTSA